MSASVLPVRGKCSKCERELRGCGRSMLCLRCQHEVKLVYLRRYQKEIRDGVRQRPVQSAPTIFIPPPKKAPVRRTLADSDPAIRAAAEFTKIADEAIRLMLAVQED